MSAPDDGSAGAGSPAPRTSLTIGVVTGVSPDRWLRVWAERMPQIPLILRPVADDDAFQVLQDGVDFVFARTDRPADDDHSVIALWEETPVAVAPKGSPFSVVESVVLAELEDETLLAGNGSDTLDLVAAGAGIARMPQSVFRASGRRDVIARPIRDAEPTRIALVWRSGTDDEVTQEFVGIVRGRTVQSSRGSTAAADPVPAPSAREPRRPSTPPAKRARFPRPTPRGKGRRR